MILKKLEFVFVLNQVNKYKSSPDWRKLLNSSIKICNDKTIIMELLQVIQRSNA